MTNRGGLSAQGERGGGAPLDRDWPLMPFVTLVLWLTVLSIGIGGMVLRYTRPKAQVGEPTSVPVRLIQVDVPRQATLTPQDTGAPSQKQPPPDDLTVPPPPIPQAPPAAPPMLSVATPSPAIACALPVAGPAPTVDAAHADSGPTRAPPDTTGTNATPVPRMATVPGPPAPRHITFGEGEGRQPPPDYPEEAAINHQEGTVVIVFTVDEHGHITHAQATKPCPWALLNQAALRAVREHWRFGSGPVRSYEISIEFKL